MNRHTRFFFFLFTLSSNLVFVWAKPLPIKGKLVVLSTVVDLEEGSERLVRKPPTDGHILSSSLSPDGQLLAFNFEHKPDDQGKKKNELRVLNLNTQDEMRLFSDPKGFDYGWSPDSKFLIYKRAIALFDVKIIQLDTFINWDLNISTVGFKGTGQLIWDKDGETITSPSGTAGTEDESGYYKIKLGEQRPVLITILPPKSSFEEISPDRTKVAFTYLLNGNPFIWDVKTQTIHQLAKVSRDAGLFFWSPDSQWVGAVLSSNWGKPEDIVAWDVQRGKRETLPVKGHGIYQWWHPQVEPPVDCEKIINARLGPGKKLTEIEMFK